MFDDLIPGRTPEGPPPGAQTPGAPSPPISGHYTNREGYNPPAGDPSVPISRTISTSAGSRSRIWSRRPRRTRASRASRASCAACGAASSCRRALPMSSPTRLLSSVTRPLSAGITAGISGLTNSYPGSSMDERYKALLQYANDRQARGDEATGPLAPLVRGVASLPASMATGGGSATVNALTQGHDRAGANRRRRGDQSRHPGGAVQHPRRHHRDRRARRHPGGHRRRGAERRKPRKRRQGRRA